MCGVRRVCVACASVCLGLVCFCGAFAEGSASPAIFVMAVRPLKNAVRSPAPLPLLDLPLFFSISSLSCHMKRSAQLVPEGTSTKRFPSSADLSASERGRSLWLSFSPFRLHIRFRFSGVQFRLSLLVFASISRRGISKREGGVSSQ